MIISQISQPYFQEMILALEEAFAWAVTFTTWMLALNALGSLVVYLFKQSPKD